MRILMTQFKIRKEELPDFEAARDRILSALARERPEGIRYTWCALPDGTSFVGWLELEDGIENPLPFMVAGQEFMTKIQGWVAAVPVRQELKVVGFYGGR